MCVGILTVLFVTFIGLQLSSAETLTSKHDVVCNPLPKIVPVNGGGVPHFVEINRCQGSVEGFDPRSKICAPKTSTKVTVKVTHGGGIVDHILENHTSCKHECVDPNCSKWATLVEKDCSCKCDRLQAPPEQPCPMEYRWNSKTCSCECDLDEFDAPENKILNKTQCKFVCEQTKCGRNSMELDENDCLCKPIRFRRSGSGEDSDNSHQGKVLAALVIGEFVLLYLIFDFLLYSKKTGLMYYIRCKCRGKPAEEANQNYQEQKSCMDNGDETNNIPLDVVVDKNGHSHVTPQSCQRGTST